MEAPALKEPPPGFEKMAETIATASPEKSERPSSEEAPDPSEAERKFFLANIAYESTQDDVKRFFSRFGAVESVKIVQDRWGASRGFGFVTMNDDEGAKKVGALADKSANLIYMCGRHRVHLSRHCEEKAAQGRALQQQRRQQSRNFLGRFGYYGVQPGLPPMPMPGMGMGFHPNMLLPHAYFENHPMNHTGHPLLPAPAAAQNNAVQGNPPPAVPASADIIRSEQQDRDDCLNEQLQRSVNNAEVRDFQGLWNDTGLVGPSRPFEIVVNNVSSTTVLGELVDFFLPFGSIGSAYLCIDRKIPGAQCCSARIQFLNSLSVSEVLRASSNGPLIFDGKQIEVSGSKEYQSLSLY